MWFVYMLECSDGSIYTGITNDLNRRIEQHNKGVGAKYTRTRLPVKLMVSFEATGRVNAAKEEYRIKKLTREQKLRLINENRY